MVTDTRPWWRGRLVIVDAAVSVALLVADLLIAPRVSGDPAPSSVEGALIVLTLVAVPFRSWYPRLVLVLTTAGTASIILLAGVEAFATFAPLLALYTVAVRGDRRTTVLAWVPTAAVLASATALEASTDASVREALGVLSWTVVAAAVGDGLRNRRAYVAAIEDRAVRAERSREEEALRRVAEERVRIARDLHDVVAHHIAVVNVQAGAAQHLLHAQPAAAATALSHVRHAAAAVLDELGDILSVLRAPGDHVVSGAPAPGLGRLDALVASFTAAGLSVDWSLHGQPRQLAPSIDLVAYRVLEEGLTNALKHGAGTAHLSVEYGPSSLRLRVVNPLRTPVAAGAPGGPGRASDTGAGSGHGLLGMTERAAAVGGTLVATPTPIDFTVEVTLPLRASAQP